MHRLVKKRRVRPSNPPQTPAASMCLGLADESLALGPAPSVVSVSPDGEPQVVSLQRWFSSLLGLVPLQPSWGTVAEQGPPSWVSRLPPSKNTSDPGAGEEDGTGSRDPCQGRGAQQCLSNQFHCPPGTVGKSVHRHRWHTGQNRECVDGTTGRRVDGTTGRCLDGTTRRCLNGTTGHVHTAIRLAMRGQTPLGGASVAPLGRALIVTLGTCALAPEENALMEPMGNTLMAPLADALMAQLGTCALAPAGMPRWHHWVIGRWHHWSMR
ncbi:hypothetical protein NDU88_007854 [Pleurodeles waltl]|uniref:Uncharacterized protein n=1 Tax=Pleurodeles waltl TaxID=8319 RepID=A0AAV7U2H9_PLEWA|nr:hypothetical protein NDU88_007854 [Pleurodeles waltl]